MNPELSELVLTLRLNTPCLLFRKDTFVPETSLPQVFCSGNQPTSGLLFRKDTFVPEISLPQVFCSGNQPTSGLLFRKDTFVPETSEGTTEE
jgi:hypothetical protein